MDANNPAYSSVGGVLFDKTQTTLLQYPAGLVGSYAIPNSVTSIGNNAFYYCNLTNIMIGTNVTSIGEGAFTEDSFTGVAIPSTVISIGDYAFSDCSSLTSVSIPNSVTSVGDYAFGYCSSLTNVTIPNSVTNMGDGAFAVCTSLTSVTIGNSVISSDEFNGCSSLTSITIPDCVTNIGDWAFWDCTDLMAITVDTRNAVYSDVDGVLFNSNLTTLIQYPGGLAGIYTVPDFVTSVGAYVFADCSKLISVTIPKGVTDIGDSAFAECLNLTSVYFVGTPRALGRMCSTGGILGILGGIKRILRRSIICREPRAGARTMGVFRHSCVTHFQNWHIRSPTARSPSRDTSARTLW